MIENHHYCLGRSHSLINFLVITIYIRHLAGQRYTDTAAACHHPPCWSLPSLLPESKRTQRHQISRDCRCQLSFACSVWKFTQHISEYSTMQTQQYSRITSSPFSSRRAPAYCLFLCLPCLYHKDRLKGPPNQNISQCI